MKFQETAEQNRLAWNAAARKHEQGRGAQLVRDFSQPGYVIFDAWEQALFEHLPVQGKRVAQLPCNNGRELISLVNLGAASGVGFDIAEENIRQANQLKSCANAACEFYRTNLLDIPAEFNGQFDFVYISEGSLIWFESLADYFAVVARLLRPAGWLLIHEAHPFTNLFEYTFDEQALPTLRTSYFAKGPIYYESSGLDYVSKTASPGPATYEFPHTLAEIFNGLLRNGFVIGEFQEYEQDLVEGFGYLEKLHNVPLSFTLTACKQGATALIH